MYSDILLNKALDIILFIKCCESFLFIVFVCLAKHLASHFLCEILLRKLVTDEIHACNIHLKFLFEKLEVGTIG